MKLFIPDDWDGEWQCVRIQWPKSLYWDAILAGMLDDMAAGRKWNENTGSIRAVQAIGDEIFNRNVPFNLCTPDQGTDKESVVATSGGCIYWECELMPCLNISNLLKIENGKLYAKDDCCQWIEVGAIAGVTESVGDDSFENRPSDPDPTYSACGKADAIVSILLSVGNYAWDQRDNDPVTAWTNMNGLFPGILSMGFTLNAILAAFDVEVLYDLSQGWYGPELFDATTWQAIKCQLAAQLSDDSTLPDKDDLFDTMYGFFKAQWPLDLLAQSFWYNVYRAIGENDVRNYGLMGATNTDVECDCPQAFTGFGNETNPSTSGWYWSAESTWSYTAPGGFNDFVVGVMRAAEHDVYGFAWFAEETGGDPIIRVKRKNDYTPLTGSEFDEFAFGTNSDDHGSEEWNIQCGDNAWSEIEGQLSDSENIHAHEFLYSDTINTPAVPKGEVFYAPIQVRADGDDSARSYGVLHFRELRNTGSPSHS
jgi:hypothetical protein